MTDHRILKRIGDRKTRGPAGGNRRQHLHREGEQDQGQVFSQPLAHSPNHSFGEQLNTGPSPSRGHFAGLLARSQISRKLCSARPAEGDDPAFEADAGQPPIHRFLIFVIYLEGKKPDHFANCSNFEQSLPKMMTSEKS
ncbi:hypothetical protein [Bradyrhizobium sp. UFLA05-112]